MLCYFAVYDSAAQVSTLGAVDHINSWLKWLICIQQWGVNLTNWVEKPQGNAHLACDALFLACFCCAAEL